MLKRFAVTAATALVVAGGVVSVGGPAGAATTVSAAARCHAHKVSGTSHWTCITPGSYCPAAAHKKYGYAYKTGKRYRCVKYSNGRWRWKRA
ncbi:hypothetical protein [Actinoallomurus iriomotensis]|uniref:Uncharacterized protein n=1 Tax=Actinoallomurus iriomotensis TaxID=478107 RepID=A0A9W6W0Q4_9ACTN|nr:hypothetical protein [Actinoallomurus iriomotensis]GLY86002.1 hypothetical protein Airi02_039310 [Actinoallomurus iriomotensis]